MTALAIAPATSGSRYSDLVAQVSTAAHSTATTGPAVHRSLLPLPADLVPGTVYQTTAYAMFHHLPENREVDSKHVRKLVREISKKNLLHLKPIDVTTTGGVVDGQHRLEAARELGAPIFYRVTEQLGEAEIASLNVAQKNWAGTDYLHYWTAKGKPAYIALTAFRERHPSISFSNARMMVSGTTNNQADMLKAGQFQAANLDKAEQVAVLIERIAQEAEYKHAHDTRFVAAVYCCVDRVEGFATARFMSKILLNPRALKPCVTHKQYLELFQEIYNYKTSEAYRVRFF